MRRLLIPSLFLFLLPSAAYCQNARYDNIVIGSRGAPVPFATVAVCTQPANTTTTPCSTLATIFSTAAGAAQANPFQTDILGNYHFYAAPGSVFTVQIYSTQIATPIVMVDISIPLSPAGNNTFTGTNTFSGSPGIVIAGGTPQLIVNAQGALNLGNGAPGNGTGAELNFVGSGSNGNFFGGLPNGGTQSYNNNLQCIGASYNNDTATCYSRIIASGTSTLTANAALGATTSQAAITTAATNTLTTDAIEWSYASAPTAGDSLCHVSVYVTANNVNFVRSNPTAGAQNVSALVINWTVVR